MFLNVLSFDSALHVLRVPPIAQSIEAGTTIEDQHGNSYLLAQRASTGDTGLTIASAELADARAVKNALLKVKHGGDRTNEE